MIITKPLCEAPGDYRALADNLNIFFKEQRSWATECECCGNEEDGEIDYCPQVDVLVGELETGAPDLEKVFALFVEIRKHYRSKKEDATGDWRAEPWEVYTEADFESWAAEIDRPKHRAARRLIEWADEIEKRREYLRNTARLFDNINTQHNEL